MEYKDSRESQQSYFLAGSFVLALRLVVGWTYFSAFWRRLVLADKLDPDTAGYIGEKFNHFLPNALGIKPMIEYLVSNPDILWWAMVAFTLIEALVGLLVMLGLFTRLMGVGVLALATGILLGSGWLGTTCLDEWQIGILGMATGFALLLTGGGRYSLDYRWLGRTFVGKWKLYPWVASGTLPVKEKVLNKFVLGGSVAILFVTLLTNQYFHGGVWGELHNKSVSPIVEISDARLTAKELHFTVFRSEGVDVYGSFLIGIELKDASGNSIFAYGGEELAHFPKSHILNRYVAKVKPGKHSLVIPLGAKAELIVPSSKLADLKNGEYKLILTDISGLEWEKTIRVGQ
ncbi:MAG: DoxX family membrane protein [Bacteroides sp.]|jgi:thiosulfate dehydrogenase [quinone] large subunit|nr:DoxX family membrane protein [Bacteroides sp.]